MNEKNKTPEMHVNIFGRMGSDVAVVEETVREMRAAFGADFDMRFHINLNQGKGNKNGSSI